SAEAPALSPRDVLDTMLGLLGFICEIKEFPHEDGSMTLQVYSPEKDRLIGRHGETLDDLQLLLNRLIVGRDRTVPKVQVDVEHWREMKDDQLAARVRQLAGMVRV